MQQMPTLCGRLGDRILITTENEQIVADFVDQQVVPLRRPGVPLPADDRGPTDPTLRRATPCRLGQRALPVVPVQGQAQRPVQRAGLHLVQVAVC